MENKLFGPDVQMSSAVSIFKDVLKKECEKDAPSSSKNGSSIFSESMAKEILELAGEAMVVCDLSGRIVLANKKAKFLFGKDLISKKFDEAIPLVAEGDMASISIRESLSDESSAGVEVFHIDDDQVKSSFIFKTGVINGEGAESIGYVVTLTDITERKRTEKRLQDALTAKSRFTAMVSHELKSPLSVVKEGISMVKDGLAGKVNDKQKKFLKLADGAADRLRTLINDILDFEKLGAGKMTFDVKMGDMNEIVLDVAASMEMLAHKRGLKLELKAEKKLPKLRFDRDRIYQVISNLVSNALKYTKKGTITIETVKEGSEVHVCVHDTGRGIRREDMPKLFSEFERIEETFSAERGTGLGLVISKNIVEKLGGAMWATSEYGKGSTFGFMLPLPKAAKKNKKRKK